MRLTTCAVAAAALLSLPHLSATAAAQKNAAPVFAPAASLIPIDTPAVPLELERAAAPYTDHREARFQSWNPTKRSLLIRTRFGDVPGIHEVSSPLGDRHQLTFLSEPASAAKWQRKLGHYFVYMSDTSGAEQYQLYREDANTGRISRITDGTSRNMYAALSPDGHSMAWASTHRNGTDLDLWVADPEKPASAHMLAEWKGGGLQPQDWSGDGKMVVVLNYISVNDSALSLVDASTGAVTDLTQKLAAGEKVSWAKATFSRDGKSIYATSDWHSEFHRLWRIPLDGGKPVCITPKADHDIDTYAFNANGTTLAYSLNDEGISRLHLVSGATGKELATPKIPTGVVEDLEFHPITGELAMSFSTPSLPYDVYTLKPGATQLTRWTESETGGLNMGDEKPAELIHWTAKDNVRLSGFLFRPPAQYTGKRPVIIDIHGGPEGRHVLTISTTITSTTTSCARTASPSSIRTCVDRWVTARPSRCSTTA
ncbi:S9 family peptidase [Granulicella cerasi]|uniref:S9 family peptidase n=1 Tax=Granulicella cerasi TaxID=741063 RepID=A0ABW1Z7D7_9BACT